MNTPTLTQPQPVTFAEFMAQFNQLPPEDQADIIARMAATAWHNLTAQRGPFCDTARPLAAKKE